MALNDAVVRARLTRAMRESGDGARVAVHLLSGKIIHGRVTSEHPPQSWPTGELVITENKATNVHVHCISLEHVVVITVIQ